MFKKMAFIAEFMVNGKKYEDGLMTKDELREWAYNAAIKAGYTPEEARECLEDLAQ